ncbi:glycoside hydrolase [Bacillus sp. FJAT-25509]|uniref:glycosyl hydrolase family 18 protein n=1 Tax=Bacillus sp. FJAT-25509 TaxID=1712029 RepID=UPI0006F5614E|nr:glycosyl hydrolase family 18 protein [Bacillus sp. FJAT-25509]KQL32822.1 glycoside hydrolase [Bacillus sp. FJAT-25509]
MAKRLLIFIFTLLFFLFSPVLSANALIVYEVKPGDTLKNISKQYKLNEKSFANLNGLDRNDNLVIGQSMIIPGSTYYVRQGETLWDIAFRHSIDINYLKSKNNITSDVVIPGQKLIIPSSPKITIWTGSYLIPKNKKTNTWMIDYYKKSLTSIFIFEFHPTSQGNIIKVKENQSNRIAWKNHIFPYATLTNISKNGFDPKLVHSLLSKTSMRKKLVNNIYTLLDKNDYKGIMIDFESLNPEDRNSLNLFIKALSEKLHRSKMEVLMAMPPKEADHIPQFYDAYDYYTLGKYVDKMFLMTYNWHWPNSPSGPIAPLNEVRKTLNYAVSVVPKSKLLLGIPQYAYDWPITGEKRKGSAYSTQNAIKMYKKYESEVYFDRETLSPAFRYTDKDGIIHDVWFEDPRSLLAKFHLVKEYALGGLGCWHLGITMPQTEQLLLNEFKIN